MCLEEAALYNERWIWENHRHDTTKLRGGIPHVSRGNAWQNVVMANNLASLLEATTIFDVKRATRAVDMAISDSGAIAHFLLENAAVVNKRKAMQPLSIKLPDGTIIKSSHTCNLDIPWFPSR